MGAIRGAICAKNTVEDISDKSVTLIRAIVDDNMIRPNRIEAVIFSVTDDLNACYPAKAVRERLGLADVAFMCLKEMSVPNTLQGCIRVCVLVKGLPQRKCVHCYLGEAATLRPDLK